MQSAVARGCATGCFRRPVRAPGADEVSTAQYGPAHLAGRPGGQDRDGLWALGGDGSLGVWRLELRPWLS